MKRLSLLLAGIMLSVAVAVSAVAGNAGDTGKSLPGILALLLGPPSTPPITTTDRNAPYVLGSLGVLPAKAETPVGTPDETAAALAKQVLAGGTGSLPALLTAIDKAGFTILHDGVVVQAPGGASQGIAFQAWEVQAMDKLIHDKLVIPFEEASSLLAGATAETANVPFATLILDGIRTHAKGTDPAMRFWALFIVELGWQGQDAYHLLSDPNFSNVNLDAVQMAFIFKRLAGDLAAFVNAASPTPQGASSTTKSMYLAAAKASSPCEFKGHESEIMDWNAVAVTTGFDKLMGVLYNAGLNTAEKIATFTGFTNLALSYVKLIMTKAMFTAELTMLNSSPPLLRTKSTTTPGEQKTLSLYVHLEEKAEWINCVRPALNVMGLDLDVPSSGAVEGAEVEWQITKGGPRVAGGVQFGYVQFKQGTDPVHGNFTDSDGKATVSIDGAPQKKPVSDKAQQVITKMAAVRAGLILKPADLYRDVKDAVPFLFGGLLTLPAELMYRLPWIFDGGYSLPVKDWGEYASGAILYSQEGSMIKDFTENNYSTKKTSIAGVYSDDVGFEVHGGRVDPAFNFNWDGIEYKQDYSVFSIDTENYRKASAYYMLGMTENASDGAYEGCNIIPGCPFPWSRTVHYQYKVSAKQVDNGWASITINPDGTYEIDNEAYGYVYESDMTGPWEYEATSTDSRPNSVPVAPVSTSGELTVGAWAHTKMTGQLSNDDPGHLVGKQTIPSSIWLNGKDAAGGISVPTTITVEWDIYLICPGTDYLTCK